MADRVLKGSRMGHMSYESDRDRDLAPRKTAIYRCDNGEEFEITFATNAEIPKTWIAKNGLEAILVEDEENQETKITKPVRTHWDMLLERRSEAELEKLLKERLAQLKKERKHVLN